MIRLIDKHSKVGFITIVLTIIVLSLSTAAAGYASKIRVFGNVPVISAFAPASGSAGSTVVITGTGFAGATAVSIRGIAVTSFTVDSDMQLTAILSSSQATGAVQVTTPSGTATSSSNFRVGPILIVVRGNSQANGATTTGNTSTIGSETTGAWPDQAAALLGTGYVWQNRSKNGATIDYLRLSDATEVAPLFGTGNYGEEWIVLQETTNQIFQANPAQQVYSKMAAWAQYWQSKGVKVAVVACYATQETQYNAEVDAINDLYRANWASFCDMLLDVKSSPYLTQPGMDPQYGYSSDGLHLNTFGNQIPAHCAVDGFKARPRTGIISATFVLPGVAVPGGSQPAPAPVINSFSQSPAGHGQFVTVTGTSLTNTTSLVVNGVDATATITANTATSVTFQVPVAAPVSGTTTLATATGTASSTAFIVRAAPGSALAFDGANDYVSFSNVTPAVSNLGPTAFTLETWVYYDGTAAVNSLIRKGGDYNLYLANGKLTAEVWDGGAGTPAARRIASTSTVPTNRWTHVAAVWDNAANRFELYENGIADMLSSSTFTATASEGLAIGATVAYGGNYLRGRLDELRIWSVARSAAQIATGLQSLPALPQAGLGVYLNFDQGTPASDNGSQTGLNELANNYGGTLTGFDLGRGNSTSNYVDSYALVLPTATAATAVSATGFTATWQAASLGQVASYVVEVATTADFTAPLAGSPFTVAVPATSLAVSGLARSTTYYYRVAAQSNSLLNQGARSNVVTVATPLPVELVAFTAQPGADQATVRLAWATATEKNSAQFEVERSIDGTAFTRVATVAAAGTSTAAQAYGYTDSRLPAPVLYYRLRQVDADGSTSYSPVRTVRLTLASASLALFPNPATTRTRLKNALPHAAVQVLDALGRVVAASTADDQGAATLALPAGLVGGVYIVRAGTQSGRLLVE